MHCRQVMLVAYDCSEPLPPTAAPLVVAIIDTKTDTLISFSATRGGGLRKGLDFE